MFQAKIQVLKKSASKGDKKKKKETTEEIARLEFELNEKHDKELKELSDQTSIEKSETPDAQVEAVTDGLGDIEIKENKVSKAQKRRDKKAEKEKERLEDIDRYVKFGKS